MPEKRDGGGKEFGVGVLGHVVVEEVLIVCAVEEDALLVRICVEPEDGVESVQRVDEFLQVVVSQGQHCPEFESCLMGSEGGGAEIANTEQVGTKKSLSMEFRPKKVGGSLEEILRFEENAGLEPEGTIPMHQKQFDVKERQLRKSLGMRIDDGVARSRPPDDVVPTIVKRVEIPDEARQEGHARTDDNGVVTASTDEDFAKALDSQGISQSAEVSKSRTELSKFFRHR